VRATKELPSLLHRTLGDGATDGRRTDRPFIAIEQRHITQQRDAAERAELLAMLGIAEGERVAPTLRAQVRRLEEQQKRRARRIQTDTLIRAVADIQTVLRDALTLQLGAQAPLLNEYLREPLQEYAARTSPAQTLSDVQAVETTLRRLRTNANARLALEALMSRFVR